MRPASDFNEIRTRDLLKFRQRSQPLQCFGWLFLKRLAHPICRTKASASRSVDANTKGRRPAKMTDMTDDWNIARALCCTSCLQVLPSARSFCTVCQTASLRGRASCCKELLNLKRLKMAEEAGKHTDLPTIHKRCPNDQTPICIFVDYLTILNLDFLRFLLILSTHLSLSLWNMEVGLLDAQSRNNRRIRPKTLTKFWAPRPRHSSRTCKEGPKVSKGPGPPVYYVLPACVVWHCSYLAWDHLKTT